MNHDDRHCPLCHGKRQLRDTSAHDYGYNAWSVTPCWACATPAEPDSVLRKDDLIDAAVDRLAAAAGLSRAEYRAREYAEWCRE